MTNGARISLDSDILLGRVRGYTSRPTPEVISRKPAAQFRATPIRDYGEKVPSKFVYRSVSHESADQTKTNVDIEQPTILTESVNRCLPNQSSSIAAKFKIYTSKIRDVRIPPKTIYGKINRNHAISALAIALIVSGILLGFNGFRANRIVETQIKAMNAVSENSVNAVAPDEDEDSLIATTDNHNSANPSIPSFLRIPILGVDAKVISVSTDSNNVIQAPGGIFEVGWYDGSAKLGETGAVFMDGHVSGWTEHGVFYDIKNLKQGDEISAEGNDGQVFTYKVVALEHFDADNVDMSKALKPYISGKQGLNIMTCGGKFNNEQQKYEERVVVYSVLQ